MYTIYDDGTDTEVFERPDGTRDRNHFIFNGFSNGIHPYHKKETDWAVEMLHSAQVNLLIINVATVDDMSSDPSKGEMGVADLKIPKVPYTHGMKNLVLFQDTEMGRGWAVLIEVNPTGEMKIIAQDHRDSIRDQTLLDSKWLKKAGIILKRKTVKSLDKLK